MKKRFLIFSLVIATLSLSAFSFINWNSSSPDQNNLVELMENELVSEPEMVNEPVIAINKKEPIEFFYTIESRFEAIKKSKIATATTIHDFIREEDSRQIAHCYSSEIIIIKNNIQTDIRAYGTGETLSASQKELLQSVGNSEHFLVRINYSKANSMIYDGEGLHFSPHYTVVPEQPASYSDGYKSLLEYINENKSKNSDQIDDKKLQAVKIAFTISKDGNMENINMDRTTNYPELDNQLINLIKGIPGKWNPARNANNETVDDVLVLSFGLADGC